MGATTLEREPAPGPDLSGSHLDRSRRSWLVTALSGRLGVPLMLLLALVTGLGAAVLTETLSTADAALVAIGLGAVLGAVSGLLAVLRFESFVIAVFAVRSSLDAFSGQAVGGLDPSTALGGMFLALGGVWLFVQWRVDSWTKPSMQTRAFVLIALAGVMSAFGSENSGIAIEAAVSVLAGATMFAVLEQLHARNPHLARQVIIGLFVSLIIPVVTGYRQIVQGGLEPDRNTGLGRITGTFVHPNTFAIYLVMAFTLAVALSLGTSGWARRLSLLAATASLPLIILTYTRVAWVSLLIGLAYIGYRHSAKLLLAMGAGLVLLVMLVPSIVTRLSDLTADAKYDDAAANSLAWRINYWGELVPLASDAPITGIGLDTVQEVTNDGLRPHNVFVQSYVETGIIGFAATVSLVLAWAKGLSDRRRRAVSRQAQLLSAASTAIALGVFVQLFSENLTTSTIVWWYAAAATTFGLRGDESPLSAPAGSPGGLARLLRPRRDKAAGALPLVRHVGPAAGTPGGIAAVLESYAELPLRRWEIELAASWHPDARFFGARLTSKVIYRLFRDRFIPGRVPDVVHVHLSYRGSFVREGAVIRVASLLNYYVVASLHGSEFTDFLERRPRLVASTLRRADVVCPLGPSTAAAIESVIDAEHGPRVVVLPNPVSVPPMTTLPDLESTRTVLFAGLVGTRKGVDVLLDAWPGVTAQIPNVRLAIAGPIDDVEVPPSDTVDYLGVLDRSEVHRHLESATMAVLPSRAEVMPIFLLEAMARARAVVSTDVSEIRWMVGDGGIVVPPGDPDALRHALLTVLSDDLAVINLGANGWDRANELFSTEASVVRLEDLYDSLLLV